MVNLDHDLVMKIYDSAREPHQWQNALDHVCANLKVRSAVLQRCQGVGSGFRTTWVARDSYSEDQTPVHLQVLDDDVNPRMAGTFPPDLRPGNVQVGGDEDIPMPTQVRKRFQENLRQVGLGRYLCADVALAHNDFSCLVLHRHPDDRKVYPRDERILISGLARHMAKALEISDELRKAGRVSSDLTHLLDKIRPGLLICDPGARLIWANSSGRHLLERRKPLLTDGEKLGCVLHDETMALHELVFRCSLSDKAPGLPGNTHGLPGLESTHPCRETRLAGDSKLSGKEFCLSLRGTDGDQRPIHVVALPMPQGGMNRCESRIALVILQPGSPFEISSRLLEKMFLLSPAEARLAKSIAEGGSVITYASEHRLAEGTVRFQLKQVLAKTDCVRQADLVRLICSSLFGDFQV
ncbi:MAG: hypothetical protein H6Q00_3130 [Holophagaceae bacterium]|nr:hypothetical protein [Holophagaceae bacterium]